MYHSACWFRNDVTFICRSNWPSNAARCAHEATARVLLTWATRIYVLAKEPSPALSTLNSTSRTLHRLRRSQLLVFLERDSLRWSRGVGGRKHALDSATCRHEKREMFPWLWVAAHSGGTPRVRNAILVVRDVSNSGSPNTSNAVLSALRLFRTPMILIPLNSY